MESSLPVFSHLSGRFFISHRSFSPLNFLFKLKNHLRKLSKSRQRKILNNFNNLHQLMIENVTSHPIPTTKLNKKTIVTKSPPTSKFSLPSLSPPYSFHPTLSTHSCHLTLATHSCYPLLLPHSFLLPELSRAPAKPLRGGVCFFGA